MIDNVVKDWMEGVDHNSTAFRKFIDFCYDKFPNQMDTMLDAFMETRTGQDLFDEYLSFMESYENRKNCEADILMDKVGDV